MLFQNNVLGVLICGTLLKFYLCFSSQNNFKIMEIYRKGFF